MSYRDTRKLQKKASEILELIQDLKKLALEDDFSVNVSSDKIAFEAWASSNCYREDNSDDFVVNVNGEVWESSDC